MKYASICLATIALLGTALATPAAADFITGANVALISIRATDGGESAEANWLLPMGTLISGHKEWKIPNKALASRGTNLGVIKLLEVAVDADPGISVNFSVENTTNSPKTYEVTTIPLEFPAIVNPLAYATAAFTLTDSDGNGATLTGLLPGGKAYEAIYNNGDPGIVWTRLVGSFTADAYDSAISKERRPGVSPNREMIPATIHSIQAHYKFELSAHDQVSLTSRFDVIDVPEPSILALLGAGAFGLAVCVFRRRKS